VAVAVDGQIGVYHLVLAVLAVAVAVLHLVV
jgi:hypothetical protein